ncbi:MAG: DUF4767 domain-containing protein, partial [Lacticaseibacillus paracasei]|nr:DUF4767 domain-containing protein [Lacticaseibacillus paracasei]
MASGKSLLWRSIMQKTFIAVCTLFLGLGLVGCGHQQQASPSSSPKKTS